MPKIRQYTIMWMEGWLLCIMKKTKEMINEERKLLRLCSQSYKDMIRKKKAMTVNDFNRFLCVITTLGLGAYEVYFSNQMFPELLKQLSDARQHPRERLRLPCPFSPAREYMQEQDL